MTFPIFWDGKILFRDGKPAMSLDCCCLNCITACFYVQNGFVGSPNCPTVSPPLYASKAYGKARIVYHGHNVDTTTTPEGSDYHTHLWILESCFSPKEGETENSVILEYINILENWAIDELAIDWTGSPDPNAAADYAGEMIDCSDTQLNYERDRFLDAPVANRTDDLFGPIVRDKCPECL